MYHDEDIDEQDEEDDSGLSKYTDEPEDDRLKREAEAEFRSKENSLPESQRGRTHFVYQPISQTSNTVVH